MRPTILLTGRNGQIGFDLQRWLAPLGEVEALDRQALDLTDANAIRDVMHRFRPHIIVNAAAYTAVDDAESEPELAWSVNAEAPRILAEEAARSGAFLVHYSTDYVFDGTKGEPYHESDLPHPLNVYGATKWAGEKAIEEIGTAYLIFRTSWVYATRGKNFLLTILRLALEHEELRVVDDQIGAPTWSRQIAQASSQVLAKILAGSLPVNDLFGIYHLSASGQASWYSFAKEILNQWEQQKPPTSDQAIPLKVERIVPICTEEYPMRARRPHYSVLSNEKLKHIFGISLPPWQEQLRGVWQSLGINGFAASASS